MTESRSRLIREVMQLTGENTKAGEIDVALAQNIEDHWQKSNVVANVEGKIVKALSTNQLPLSLGCEYSVGKGTRE